MDSSFPVLVTLLPDRRELARLVRAALRHEVAHVPLAEPPRQARPHTLDLRVSGSRGLSLLAEPAGSAHGGQYPLRLYPLHHAQAVELQALLAAEGEGVASAPIARAMVGDAPPIAAAASIDPRKTARLVWGRGQSTAPPSDDPKKTKPSVRFGPDEAREVSAAPKRAEVRAWTAPRAGTPAPSDDLRRTVRSATWAQPLPTVESEDVTSREAVSPALAVVAEEAFVDQALAEIDAEKNDTDVPPTDDDDHADDELTLVRAPAGVTETAPAPAASEPDSMVERGIVPSSQTAPSGRASAGRKKKTTRSRARGADARRHAADDDHATVARASAPAAPLVGRRIAEGKYLIEGLMGAGAAGAVYKATHRELRRTVAVKVLHPHYQHDPQFMKSFRGEALAASQLDHPSVTRVLDFGQEPDGLVYIVMEYLSGRTLQNLLDEESRLSPERAVEIMIQVCAALSVAHDNGIIHRDIKPDNIMLVPSRNDEGGTFELVKVCDFGIAALHDARADLADLAAEEGAIAGTPEYMSPEQARGADIDARADVYACGICLYELVTGRPPFLGEHAGEILLKQLEEPPRPPSELVPGLDPLLEEIILRAIQKDPERRQQSARELRVDMKELVAPRDGAGAADLDEPSVVVNVPGLDDPASGFAAFFDLFSSALLRQGRFERGHPEAAQAAADLARAAGAALRGRREITFARRDKPTRLGFCVMSGHAEIAELKRLLGSAMYGSRGAPIVEALVKKGVAALTLREGLADAELAALVEALRGPLAHAELEKELLRAPTRHVSVLFATDVLGRDRKLTWKVGLSASRLARDLRALSHVRGMSLKKMREVRDDLVAAVARLLTKGDEVRQLLANADLVDDAVANLRGFSAFRLTPLVIERLLHDACADAVFAILAEVDQGTHDPRAEAWLRALGARLANERSPLSISDARPARSRSNEAVAELFGRGLLAEADLPPDLVEALRASSLADALAHDPSGSSRALDAAADPETYARELASLASAMAVLARRGDADALLAAVGALARYAKGSGGSHGSRERQALRTMKSIIDKERLLPIANALFTGPPHQRDAARQLLVLAGSAGAHALYAAREGLADPSARPTFVKVFRETGPAGAALLCAVLPQIQVNTDGDVALVEDLLRAVPDRHDPVLGDAVARFLAHPRLRPSALAAIVPLLGERAKKPLMDALEFAEEPARVVAITELRRLRAIDDSVVGIIERLLTMRGSASDELRAVAAAALADAPLSVRARVIALLAKGIEGKRGVMALLRGEVPQDEGALVTEAMARALLTIDRAEGIRAVKARLARADGALRGRLSALLQQG